MTTGEDGRVRRAQESREARRLQIKQTALSVFADAGYHATSVSDLVAAAGVARGTFYLYFDSKDAIFLELLDDLTAQLRARIVGVDLSAGAAPLAEQLERTVARLLQATIDNRPLTRIIFREAVGLHAPVDERLRAFDDDLHAYVVRSIAVAQQMDAVRELDPAVSAACVVGSVRELVNRLVVSSDAAVDVQAVAAALVAHHLVGLVPRL